MKCFIATFTASFISAGISYYLGWLAGISRSIQQLEAEIAAIAKQREGDKDDY